MLRINKFKLFAACVSLIICLSFVQSTYAKYANNVTATSSVGVARWKIKVNTVAVTNANLAENTIVPVFAGNEYMQGNVIAPLSTGYFDLVIDATDADVSFDYTIASAVNPLSNVTDIVTTGYSVNGGEVINFTNYNENITGSIAHNTLSTTIRVYVLWNDGEGATMTNADDTIASDTENSVASLDVTMAFVQSH